MLCKDQYEMRKPLLLSRQIHNSFIVQEKLHNDVLIELKQIAKFYKIKRVKDLIYNKKIFYSHSVFMVDEGKFDSFTYSDENYNHFKFVKKKLTDYYVFVYLTTGVSSSHIDPYTTSIDLADLAIFSKILYLPFL